MRIRSGRYLLRFVGTFFVFFGTRFGGFFPSGKLCTSGRIFFKAMT